MSDPQRIADATPECLPISKVINLLHPEYRIDVDQDPDVVILSRADVATVDFDFGYRNEPKSWRFIRVLMVILKRQVPKSLFIKTRLHQSAYLVLLSFPFVHHKKDDCRLEHEAYAIDWTVAGTVFLFSAFFSRVQPTDFAEHEEITQFQAELLKDRSRSEQGSFDETVQA